MAIELPQPRLPKVAVPRLLDWGADQKAPQGGAYQRLNRLGNRFALDISYPRLKPEPDGRILASRLRRAKTEGALFPVPQPGLSVGVPGNPVVDGAGQAGAAILLRGFTAGYQVREGQFFSIIHGGRRYLHCASADAVAGGDGKVTLSIHPMLRIQPSNGAICEFAKPYIEGIVGGQSIDVELSIAKMQVPSITITERA
ncbi:hypothetical protein HNP52_000350 [Sphingomonas kyeonggiensis]|uniref:Uncharacterized protein n=1 Tax=Sphingomonas kyeonggiensis TaxID=1268553 RepID=A0A7W7JXQ8_9SPHN|nr:hypothetical protein [Sphingomonas kyeonggiensis]MBB4837299.1 hypothetical protein [Sphingomonas kyeonggiensis]